MTAREETAAEFAAAMNAQVYVGDDVIANAGRMDLPEFTLPPSDAPLHEHLAFVGHVAEAGGWRVGVCHDEEMGRMGCAASMWTPGRGASREWSYAPDLSHAAMLAAIKAKLGAL